MFPHSGEFIYPIEKAQKTIIFLHGFGSNGKNLISIADFFKNDLPPTLFWAPDAIERCNESYDGFMWFQLYNQPIENLMKKVKIAAEIVEKAILNHVGALNLELKDVILVGFSQGAMLALYLMKYLRELGGVIAYSGKCFNRKEDNPSPKQTKVLLVHGSNDQVVPFENMWVAKEILQHNQYAVESLMCDGLEHSIDSNGVEEAKKFIKQIWVKEDERTH